MSGPTLLSLNDIIHRCSESLEELTLSRCRLMTAHIEQLTQGVPLASFASLGNLVKLNLSENKINDRGAILLGTFIEKGNSLISLNLELNFLHISGALSILQAVRESKTLF